MTKKILFPVALCLFFLVGTHTYIHAQVKSKEKTSEKFTKEEKEKFSVIYEYAFKNPFDVIKSTKKNLPSINIPEKRFGEIFSAQFDGKKIVLTSEEKIEMEKLQNLMAKDYEEHEKAKNNLVIMQNLDQKIYEEMNKEHIKNRFFQNEIYEIIKKREILSPKK